MVCGERERPIAKARSVGGAERRTEGRKGKEEERRGELQYWCSPRPPTEKGKEGKILLLSSSLFFFFLAPKSWLDGVTGKATSPSPSSLASSSSSSSSFLLCCLLFYGRAHTTTYCGHGELRAACFAAGRRSSLCAKPKSFLNHPPPTIVAVFLFFFLLFHSSYPYFSCSFSSSLFPNACMLSLFLPCQLVSL